MEKDAQDLRTAMKGMGTNEAEIIRITMSHTKKERQTLRLAYKTCFGRDLMEDLSKELSGNFKDTILALYEDPIEYDAKCLYKAMKGLGTDEDTLIEIICTRPNWMLKAISEVFLKLYKKELTKWVESETSGDFRRILLSLLQCNRSENTHPNEDQMKQEAHQLYTAGIYTKITGKLVAGTEKTYTAQNSQEDSTKNRKPMQRQYTTLRSSRNFSFFIIKKGMPGKIHRSI